MGRNINVTETKIEDIRLVYQYLDRKNKKTRGQRKTYFQLRKITADILKVSARTVSNVIDGKKDTQHSQEKVIEKRKATPLIDGFHKQLIRKTVHDLYGERILPKIPVIQARLINNTNISICNKKLRLVLHELNYVF